MGLEEIQSKMETAGELLSVVRTMKSLASVNIRQYERAVGALDEYARTVEMAWTVFFQRGGGFPGRESRGPAVILVIGSDQGMAGQFNDVLLDSAEDLARRVGGGDEVSLWASGERVAAGLADVLREPGEYFGLPGSLSGIDPVVLEMMRTVTRWQERGVRRFYLLANRPARGGSFEPRERKLLPLDREWSAQFKRRDWPRKNLPMLFTPPGEFFEHLFSQYLYISLFRALGQSLAAENAARLASMQAAQKNIEELSEELGARYRQERQTAITSELMDIVSGFEAMNS